MRKVMCHACIGLMVLSLGFPMNPVFGSDNSVKNQASWDNLSQLYPGQEIRIKRNDAKTIRGNFRSGSDEAIVIILTSGDQTISRPSVTRISIRKNGHRWRNTLIGVGIGAGTGYGIGAASEDNFMRGASTIAGVFLGVIVGAIGGAVIPSGGWRDIYKTAKNN
jgi:hypothetical protein